MISAFFKNFFSIDKFFVIIQGPKKGNIKRWIITWFFIDLNMLLICGILYLCKATKPSAGDPRCIGRFDDGINNKITLNIKEAISSGGSRPETLYQDGGQSTTWIDTGFETNGDDLVIYVNGDYFPWGKEVTEKQLTYQSTIQQTEDGITTSMDLTEGYVACELNTDLFYKTIDNEDIRVMYSNFLNKYTQLNSNNRLTGKSYVLYNSSTDITGFSKIQSDCIYHNNCDKGGNEDQSPIGCVLKNGAGIYMKIGENSDFAYHIINHLVPELEKKCVSGVCEYNYKTYDGKVSVTQIPFGLPLMVYNKDKINSWIRDTQEKKKDVIPITSYDWGTDYEFTTYEVFSSDKCEDIGKKTSEYETIGGICYKSVVKKMTTTELQNHYCPVDEGKSTFKHPDELCAPKAGQRIFIKPADTFYDDDDGEITLTFISGVKDKKMSTKGLQLSWIQYIAYKILSPLIGDQIKEDDPEKLFTTERLIGEIKITNKSGEKIYITSYNNDYILKTSRYGSKGLLLKVKNHEKSVNFLEHPAYQSTEQNVVIIKPKEGTNMSDIQLEFVKNTITGLIKIDNLNEGLFVKVRNMILNSSIFLTVKIIFVVWYVFSFGIGVVNRSNLINLPTFTKDWKNVLIFLWATDAGNYQIIDDMLWPALFRGAESFAMIFLEAGNNVYGSSIHTTSAFDFLDNAIQSMTSKEVWLKVVALGTHMQYFYLFLFWLPLFCTGIIKFIRCICGTVFGLVITVAFLGILIMLMPVYALVSLLKQYSGEFKNVFKKMIQEAIHYSLELGFFCFFIGFVYQAYFDAISFSICWQHVEYDLFGWAKIKLPFLKIKTVTWEFVNDAGDNITGKGQTMLVLKSLLNAFIFFLCGMLSGYFVSASRYAANLFHKSPGTGFGLSKGAPFSNFFDKTIDGVTSGLSYVSSFSFLGGSKGNGGKSGTNGGNGKGNGKGNSNVIQDILNRIRGGNNKRTTGSAGNNNSNNTGIINGIINRGRGDSSSGNGGGILNGILNNNNRKNNNIENNVRRGDISNKSYGGNIIKTKSFNDKGNYRRAIKPNGVVSRGNQLGKEGIFGGANIQSIKSNIDMSKVKNAIDNINKSMLNNNKLLTKNNILLPQSRPSINDNLIKDKISNKDNNVSMEKQIKVLNKDLNKDNNISVEQQIKTLNKDTNIKRNNINDDSVLLDNTDEGVVINKIKNIAVKPQSRQSVENIINDIIDKNTNLSIDEKQQLKSKIMAEKNSGGEIQNIINDIISNNISNINKYIEKSNKTIKKQEDINEFKETRGGTAQNQNIDINERNIIDDKNNNNNNNTVIEENGNKQPTTMLIQENDMLMSVNEDMLMKENKDLMINNDIEMIGGTKLNQETQGEQQLSITTENQMSNLDKKVEDTREQKAEAMQELLDTMSKNKQAEQALKQADESDKEKLQQELQQAEYEKQKAIDDFTEQAKEFIKTQRQQKELYKKNNMLDSWSKKKK